MKFFFCETLKQYLKQLYKQGQSFIIDTRNGKFNNYNSKSFINLLISLHSSLKPSPKSEKLVKLQLNQCFTVISAPEKCSEQLQPIFLHLLFCNVAATGKMQNVFAEYEMLKRWNERDKI